MRIRLTLNYNSLDHLAPLFTKLYECYPTGSVWFFEEGHGELDVQPHVIKQEDRDFLDSLREQHLISHWMNDLY